MSAAPFRTSDRSGALFGVPETGQPRAEYKYGLISIIAAVVLSDN